MSKPGKKRKPQDFAFCRRDISTAWSKQPSASVKELRAVMSLARLYQNQPFHSLDELLSFIATVLSDAHNSEQL